jgi:hypothetical protein
VPEHYQARQNLLIKRGVHKVLLKVAQRAFSKQTAKPIFNLLREIVRSNLFTKSQLIREFEGALSHFL